MNLVTALQRILDSQRCALERSCRRLRRREDGQSLVEFALVLPPLLIVLTGVFSFGIILTQYEVLTDAVSAGARAFALSAGGSSNSKSTATNGDPCAYAATTIQNSAPNLTATSLTYTIIYTPSGGSATTYSGTGASSPSCSSLTMNFGDIVQVKATYPVTPLVFGWTKTITMSAQTSELVQ